jgi:uncharacterized repeat protein (TIGR04138 family)
MDVDFYLKVEEIVKEDPRYKPDAYEFVMRGLFYTQKKLKRKGHVTGKELAEGIRDLAIEEFGGMARAVLAHWGITKTSDFGEIVYNMISKKLLSKTESDSKEDFRDVYDFKEAFRISLEK